MEEMQKTLELLNYKIEVYEECLLKRESEMVKPFKPVKTELSEPERKCM